MNGVYDKEKSKDTKAKPDGSHDKVALKSHELAALDQMEAGLSDKKMSKANKKELEKLKEKAGSNNPPESGWKTTTEEGNTGFKVTGRRLAVAGAVSGIAVGGSMGFMSFLSGPLEFIHLSKMMQGFHLSENEETGNSRSSRFIRSILNKKPENGRLGAAGTKYAKRWEKRMVDKSGVRVAYNESGRFVGYIIVDDAKAKRLVSDLESEGIPIADSAGDDIRAPDGSPAKGTGRFVDARDTNFRKRRSITKAGVKSAGVNKVSSVLGYRALIKRAGIDMHPLNRAKKKADESLADFRERYREEQAEEDRNGVASPDADEVFDGEDTDGDGDKDPSAEQRTANQAGLEAVDDAKADPEKGKVSVKAKLGAGAALGVGVLCTVRQMSEDVGEYQNANVILPLIRIGARFTSVGNQLMFGEGFSQDELAALRADINDLKGSWASAESIQQQMGRKGGVPIPPGAKPGADKNGMLEFVDSLFAAIGPAGDVVCNPITQLAFSAVDLLNPVTLAKTAAGAAASAAGVNPEDKLVEWITEKFRGEEVDTTNATAPERGSFIDYGNFLGKNNQAMSMGGRALTAQEVAEWDAYEYETRQQENSQKSYFARMFDLGNIDSMASQTLIRNPGLQKPQVALANFMSEPLGVLGSLQNNIASIFTPKASALAKHDYGVPSYGFSLGELQDERFEDPFENAAIVEQNLNTLNEKYGKCFGTTVENNRLTFTEAPRYDQLETGDDGYDACNDTSLSFKRFRFYVLDTVTEHSLACYEGADSSCSQVGMDSAGGTEQPTTSNGKLPEGTVQELAQKIVDSENVTAAPQYMAQIEAAAGGNMTCHMNPTILGLIVALSADFKLNISSLNRFCTGVLTGSGTSSYHWRDGGGHAVDIDIINGKSSQGRAAHDTDLLKKALPLLPSGSGIGQSNCGGDKLEFPEGVTEFSDTCNHVHIQVPVQ